MSQTPETRGTPEASEGWVSTGVAARMLGVGSGAVRSYINSGDLEAFRLPTGHWRIKVASIEALRRRGQAG